MKINKIPPFTNYMPNHQAKDTFTKNKQSSKSFSDIFIKACLENGVITYECYKTMPSNTKCFHCSSVIMSNEIDIYIEQTTNQEHAILIALLNAKKNNLFKLIKR